MSIRNHWAAWTLSLAATAAAGCTLEPSADNETKPAADNGTETSSEQQAVARQCSDDDFNAIIGGARVQCSGTIPARLLPPSKTIKKLRFEGTSANGVTFDCGGATVPEIEVRSKITPLKINGVDQTFSGHPIAAKDSWGYYIRERAENITIKNCKVDGGVRVWGLGENGQDGYVWYSSYDETFPGHTARARDAAPTKITFDNLVITGQGTKNTYYMAPGVTYTTLKNSEIKGSTTVNVYLDAESAFNTIRNNYIHAPSHDDKDRELIAIDGSSSNTIINNYFSSLQNGGIFLYRNCGEGGTIRHATPSNNQIINNTFYYNKYDGYRPSVWLGSRNTMEFRSYCPDDEKRNIIPGTSSKSDWDYAQNNVVMQNQIYKLDHKWMIRTGLVIGDALYEESQQKNKPNFVKYNTTVSTAVGRPAGCYMGPSYAKDFLVDNEKLDVVINGVCNRLRCRDNKVLNEGACAVVSVPVPPPTDKPAEGFLEVADETAIIGWAGDADYKGSIPVHIYIDGVLVEGVHAADYRPDVAGHNGHTGYNGFSWIPPKLSPGPHEVRVYAIGMDSAGNLTNRNPLLAWAPQTIYAKDYIKYGNNGTVSCNTFCEGTLWGEVGGCVGAFRNDTNQRLTCSDVVGLLPSPYTAICECERGFIKPGNNGDASCSVFCEGAVWGTVGRCVGAVRGDNSQRISCGTAPGHLGGPQLACQCVPFH